MRVKPEQLTGHLERGLAPLYLLSGDEPLLLQEAADQILQNMRAAGFDERMVLTVEGGFDWSSLQQEQAALSLFAEKRVVDLRIPDGKPGKQGGALLADWSAQPPEEKLLLIRLPKLDAAAQRAKWFKTVDQAGVVVQFWPLDVRQIPGWIMQRMRKAGLNATAGAAALIAERVEGNLLAAVQEIEKLTLLYPQDQLIDEALVLQLVSDSARFDPFQLADAILVGDRGRALRIVRGLKEEGTAIQVVLWAVQRDLRELAAIGDSRRLSGHKPLEYVAPALWKRRLPLFSAMLKRVSSGQLEKLVRSLGGIDRSGKGMADGDPWIGLESLILMAT